jgi:predicted GTPase
VRWPWSWRWNPEAEDEALRAAERLRDRAQEQQRRAAEIAPRVDAVVASLREVPVQNGLRSMIENVGRGLAR